MRLGTQNDRLEAPKKHVAVVALCDVIRGLVFVVVVEGEGGYRWRIFELNKKSKSGTVGRFFN